MAALTPTVVVENLSFRYQGRRRPTLENVSFSVTPGETLLILGPSGGGKSTLALCLNGLIPHSIPGEMSGRVTVAGRNVAETPVAELARSVGLVFQDPDSQFCMLRVDDEVAFGLENLNVPRQEMKARISRALDQVGLAGLECARIDRLSGGARQRLALACVMAMDPDVLIFDEPTSNLDPAGSEEVFAGIAHLQAQRSRTILIIEHRLDHLIHLVDRVLVIGPNGSQVALATPTEVLRDYADQLDEFGIWIPQVSEVANHLIRRGARCEPYPLTIEQGAVAFGRLLEFSRPLTPSSTTQGKGNSPPLPLCGRGAREERNPDVPSATPAVEMTHLTCRYPTGQVALQDVNLTIPEGSFFAIVGPNGAGKSTLARHLIGSIRPPAGTVRLFGRDIRSIPATEIPRFVGYVFQNPEHQFVARSVYDELAFGLRIRHLPEVEIQPQVEAMLADFGLFTYAGANPFTLSHGEKRRLSVATMLILGQRILVLDEPTFGQDRKNTAALLEKLAELNRAGRTIVMITHDIRLVAEYASQVAVLINGSVAYLGSPEDLFRDSEQLERSHLVTPPILELSRRLGQLTPGFPPVTTSREFLAEMSARMTPAMVSEELFARKGSR